MDAWVMQGPEKQSLRFSEKITYLTAAMYSREIGGRGMHTYGARKIHAQEKNLRRC